MTDHSFDDDMSRRLYDPSHPLYVPTAAENGPVRLSRDGSAPDLGPLGRLAVYAGFAIVVSYFALILLVGAN